jgi:Dolichyl-phosphate-mannose-protein mannosyltransferase
MDAGDERSGSRAYWWNCRSSLSLLLLATFVIRALYAGQPIVENYVGRQIPTAMVARNLDRGSGFLRPTLDTAPFPNYFVVEPPIYESGVVALKRATGLGLDEAGRIFSALATALAAWGLYMLARRREGTLVALAAVAAFAVFPLTIRYGRAFQPDALMLGAVVAGLASWDEYRSVGGWYWLVAGWLLLTLGFATKITAAFLLIPLLLFVARTRSPRELFLVCSTLLPAALWYAWASYLLALGEGSRASADNRLIWLGHFGPVALLEPETLKFVSWCLLVRAFTPVGAGLALVGMFYGGTARGRRDALWLVWGISAMLALAFLARKLHHEYYWLLIAPVVAVGIGRTVVLFAQNRRAGAATLSAAFVVLSWVQVRSTWRTPPEWSGLEPAADAVRATVPSDAWAVAPEALLFQADRRGCRLEYTLPAAARAAGEWGKESSVEGPHDLIETYRYQGARYFADLGSRADDPRRKGLHDFVRQRYKVIVDGPEVIIADLADSEMHWNAN